LNYAKFLLIVLFLLIAKIAQATPLKNGEETSQKGVLLAYKSPFEFFKNLSTKNTIGDEIALAPTKTDQNTPSEKEEYSSFPSPYPFYLSFANRGGEGIGYEEGFSTVGGLIFFPSLPKNTHIFMDLRYHIFNDARSAANGGLGVRIVPGNSRKIIGLNCYYDYRGTSNSHWHQIGVGAEFLTSKIDFRVNGYIPLKNKHRIEHFFFNNYIGDFFFERNRFEYAFPGFDAELGGTLFENCQAVLYAAIGPYVYPRGDACFSIIGGRFRLEFDIKQIIFLEASTTWDDFNKTIVQGQVTFRFPIGKSYYRTYRNILTQSVIRNEIITTDKFSRFFWNWDSP
jgi:hypothetical protein